jgi:hypothetical protein
VGDEPAHHIDSHPPFADRAVRRRSWRWLPDARQASWRHRLADEKVTLLLPRRSKIQAHICQQGGSNVDGRLSVGLPEVFAGSAQWATYAGTFADVTPPEVTSVWPSAVAVGAIHADVAASHAAFGARLAETADRTQRAGISYAAQDVEQNAQAMSNLITDAVQS